MILMVLLKQAITKCSTMGILKNRPELYVRLALAKMKRVRENGGFEQLSALEQLDSLMNEFVKDPSNFTPAKCRSNFY